MLCDRILWNLEKTRDSRGKELISVGFTWQECRARSARKALPDGTALRVILPPGIRLSHGDVLYEDEKRIVWVDSIRVSLVVTTSRDPAIIAKIAYELGNLHLPVEISADQIRTLADGPAEAVIRECGLVPTFQTDRFAPLPLPNGVTFTLSPAWSIQPGK